MELLINLKEQNTWIKDRFSNKDLITFEELMTDYEDLIFELDNLKEENKSIIADRDDNFERVSIASQLD